MSYILVDGNSIGHAASSASPLSVNGQEVHAIFHTLKMLKKAKEDWGSEYKKMIVLWDSKQYWRKEQFPAYKEKTVPNTPAGQKALEESIARKESYKAQKPFIVKALKQLGITQIVANGYEADDLAGFLSKHYTSKGQKVLLLTGDKDWLQLVNQHCVWYDPIRDRICKKPDFFEFTGFSTPKDFLQGKALIGDNGDNLDRVPGIGEKCAPLIIEEFGSVQGLYDAFDSFEGEYETKGEHVLPKSLSRYRKKINEFCTSGRDRFSWNLHMMNLMEVKISAKEMTVIKSVPSFECFKALCESFAFKSILRDMPAWKQLFGGNE